MTNSRANFSTAISTRSTASTWFSCKATWRSSRASARSSRRRRAAQGDTSPAQIIFQRYLERLDQRAAYVAELLKTEKFDFTADERYHYDRKDAPRPRDLAAAQQLWRQQLRFEYLQEKLAGKKEDEIAQTLSRRSARLVQTMRKFNDQTVLELYLNALAHVYDPHSDYMGREQLQSFNIGMNLSLVGIGATLQTEDGYCKIRELVPGGPAARSGQLKNGDRIVGVAQGESKEFTDLVDMPLPQAVDLIRGAKGTTVRLIDHSRRRRRLRRAQDGLDRARRDQTRRPAGQGAHRRSARRGWQDAARRRDRSARLLRQRRKGRDAPRPPMSRGSCAS